MYANFPMKTQSQVIYLTRKIYPKPFNKMQCSKKIVIRRLPPDMNSDTFLELVGPLPPHDYYYYVKANMEYGRYSFSRAYINFMHESDLYTFKEKYDSYVFLNSKGAEYPAVVEFAPFSRIPRRSIRRFKDSKLGTIESNSYYIEFVQLLEVQSQKTGSKDIAEFTTQVLLNLAKQNEEKTKPTPLLTFLSKKKIEKPKYYEDKWRYINAKKFREHYGRPFTIQRPYGHMYTPIGTIKLLEPRSSP